MQREGECQAKTLEKQMLAPHKRMGRAFDMPLHTIGDPEPALADLNQDHANQRPLKWLKNHRAFVCEDEASS